MTVLYPLGTGSRYGNFELRMSLRSIEKNLSGFTNVVLIGEKPPWIHNITHVGFKDTSRIADQNICRKILRACECEEVTEDFLFFNDDHFLLHPFTIDFPYFYNDTLEKYVKKKSGSEYAKRARNTLDYLINRELPIKHFDIHTPIIYNKSHCKAIFSALPWTSSGYILKSVYANSLRIEGVNVQDHKNNHIPNKSVQVWSTMPGIRKDVIRWIQGIFPKPSRFE